MVTSPQRSTLYNGHLSTTVTSSQRSALYNGHLSITVPSPQRSPLCNGHLSITVTSPQRPPLYNGHLFTTVTSPQRSTAVKRLSMREDLLGDRYIRFGKSLHMWLRLFVGKNREIFFAFQESSLAMNSKNKKNV